VTTTQGADSERGWRRTAELPAYVFDLLLKSNRAINPVAIVATIDPDGAPRTAPFGSLRAVNPRLLRLACNRHHDTYSNLCRDARVSVAVLAPGEVAVSIRGRARVVKHGMAVGEYLNVLEIDVEEVKNDMMRRGAIESGIGFRPPDDLMDFYVGAIAEIEDM